MILNDFEYNFALKFGNTIANNFCLKFQKCALVILKPECLKMNKVYLAIDILKSLNYMPVYISIKKMSQNQALSLWKYDWTDATISRVLLNCVAAHWSESAILIMKDMNNISRDSCEYLNSLKGSSINYPENRNFIRGKLETINNFLNFIHCADNNTEMIRELLILFDFNELVQIIELLNNDKYLSNEDINYIFNNKIDNCEIKNIDAYFDDYINFYYKNIQNEEEKSIYKQLKTAQSKNEISSNLFLEIYKRNKIIWSWENLVLFTSFTNFID